MHVKLVPMSQKINDVASTNMDFLGVSNNRRSGSVMSASGYGSVVKVSVEPTLLHQG
jgi:hypothetical protein